MTNGKIFNLLNQGKFFNLLTLYVNVESMESVDSFAALKYALKPLQLFANKYPTIIRSSNTSSTFKLLLANDNHVL